MLMVISLFVSLSLAAQTNLQKVETKKISADDLKGLTAVSINSLTREGQEELLKNYTPVIIPDCFILGTLSDKTWLAANKLRVGEIDTYQSNEDFFVKYLGKFVQDSLGIRIAQKKDETTQRNFIFSTELAKRLNNYFLYSNDAASLSPDLLKTDPEICSYLLGAYFRFGKKISKNTYQLQNFNVDVDRMFSILRKAGCDVITYKHFKGISGGGLLRLNRLRFLKNISNP